VTYLGDVTCSDRLAVFLELVGYGCLQSLIESYGAIVPHAVARYTRHVADGLAFLHGRGIIHRDVKGES
jgi:serine/threonine protein kinase